MAGINREKLLSGLGTALGIGGDYFSAKGGGGTPYADQLRKQALATDELNTFGKKLDLQAKKEVDVFKQKDELEKPKLTADAMKTVFEYLDEQKSGTWGIFKGLDSPEKKKRDKDIDTVKATILQKFFRGEDILDLLKGIISDGTGPQEVADTVG